MPNCREIEPLVTACLDGEASEAERTLVDVHLGACPPCRGRASAESAARVVLRARSGALTRDCAPEALRARCAAAATVAASRSWTRFGTPLAMAAALLLAVGAGLFWLTARSNTVLAAQLTIDHVKCFEMVDGAIHDNPQVLQAGLAARYGFRMTVPPDSDREGLRLMTARRCLYVDGRVAHVMYSYRGEPVSLYVLPGTERPPDAVHILGHESLMWSDRGQTYLIIGRQSREELERVATYIRAANR